VPTNHAAQRQNLLPAGKFTGEELQAKFSGGFS